MRNRNRHQPREALNIQAVPTLLASGYVTIKADGECRCGEVFVITELLDEDCSMAEYAAVRDKVMTQMEEQVDQHVRDHGEEPPR